MSADCAPSVSCVTTDIPIAIHGMSLTLRHELAPFGIQVTSIIPGGVLTGTARHRVDTLTAKAEKHGLPVTSVPQLLKAN